MIKPMPFFLRLLVWNLKTALRMKRFFLAILVFGLVGLSSAAYVLSCPPDFEKNVWDAVFVAFAGPGVWDVSFLKMLWWFLPTMMFLYLFGDIAASEFTRGGVFIIPRIGSRRLWWLGKIIALLFLVIGYTIFDILSILVSSMTMLPWSSTLSPFLRSGALWQAPPGFRAEILLAWIIVLIPSTLFACSLLQMALSVLLGKPHLAFLAVSAILLLSWLGGMGQPTLARWLPGSQSMLLRHTYYDPSVPGFSLTWSLFYNAALIVAVLLVSSRYIRRLDLWKEFSDVHMEERQ